VIQTAIDAFSRLDAIVNNAGVLRDRVLVNLTEDDWDVVVRVNLRGTFLVTRAAGRYWRDQHKAGGQVRAAVVNTSSESGVFGNPGQANYAAAKAGIASLTQVAAKELARYGIRVNAILPQAKTRLAESTFGDAMAPKAEKFDRWHPGNVAPFVAYLCCPSCEISGEVFLVGGSRVQRVRPWELDPEWKLSADGRWSVDGLEKAVVEAGVPRGQQWSANPSGGKK
jgi:NAD(P)-dependent dehydrogenase (short-subunit alcohol dehydrogenase family)